MYMVKQVAALTGVPEATLRVWERRYGIVRPQRSSGGYRLYDESQLQALRQMAALVSGGVPASRAAQTVLAAQSGKALSAEAEPSDDALIEAAASLDTSRLSRVIREALGTGPFEQVVESWLQPQLVQLGKAWESGRISTAQEHFASAGLMRALAAEFEQAQPAPGAATVLVGLPAGDHHQLALLAFATCLRRRGANVVYLGGDVPVRDWVQAAEHTQPRAAVIGVTAEDLTDEAQRVIHRLGEVSPPLSVWTGGSLKERVEHARLLPDGVAEAAAELWLALSGGLT